ncbi:hypothetical protein [Tropicimonas sp. S265A]|uniref:hypothetical protein n=1 Tax=Tropicimonas sp. S265A TaxID=3415134 RepID=UPI003C7D01CC
MDKPSVATHSPCVVIHSNPLVQLDLRETLVAAGAKSVEIAASLKLVSVSACPVVFIEGAFENVIALPEAQQWVALGTPVVVMNGHRSVYEHPYQNIHVLEQPFRTDDVQLLLRKLKVF